jgi:hypothetical protein
MVMDNFDESENTKNEENLESDFYHRDNIPNDPENPLTARQENPPGTVSTQRGVDLESPNGFPIANPANRFMDSISNRLPNKSVKNISAGSSQGESKGGQDKGAPKQSLSQRVNMAKNIALATTGNLAAGYVLAKDFLKDPKAFISNIKNLDKTGKKTLLYLIVFLFIIIFAPIGLIIGYLLAPGQPGYVPPAQYSLGSTIAAISCQQMVPKMQTTYNGKSYTLYLPSVDGTGIVGAEDPLNLTNDASGKHQYEFPNDNGSWESLSGITTMERLISQGKFTSEDLKYYISSRWPNSVIAWGFNSRHGNSVLRSGGITLPPESAYWGKKLAACNPKTSKCVVLVAVEYGPDPSGGVKHADWQSQKNLWQTKGGTFNPPGFLGRSYGIPTGIFSSNHQVPSGYTGDNPFNMISLSEDQSIQVGFLVDQSLKPGSTFQCAK